ARRMNRPTRFGNRRSRFSSAQIGCQLIELGCGNRKSALEEWSELLLQVADLHRAVEALAVDEERRRRVHAEFLGPDVANLLDLGLEIAVVEALLEALLREPRLLGDLRQRIERLRHHPAALLLEQGLDHRVVAVLRGAARQHEAGSGKPIEREFTHDEA